MKSKIFSKTVKKTTLLSVIVAVVLAAALVIGALIGFNKSVVMDDSATLTVSVRTYSKDEKTKDAVQKACEKVFEDAGVSAEYVLDGKMVGDSWLVFVFDKKVDAAALQDDVKSAIASATSVTVNVSATKEVAASAVAKHFVLRAAISVAVFAVLAFAYVAVRYRSVWTGAAVGVSVLVAMLLTAGVIVLTRIPVTVSVGSVVAIAGLLTAVLTVLTLGKLRAAKKEGAEGSDEEQTISCIPVCEGVLLGGGLAVAMILIGVLGKTAAAWYATAALVGIAVALLVSLFYMPAVYLSMKKVGDERAVKGGYVGAKRTSKKEKKAVVSQEVAEESVAQEVEEVAEEPAEEVVEETTEETAEEVAEEPAEEVVEETTEEVVEETTEEVVEE